MMPKTAMVLAAGEGTRMRPITDRIPKPLVPVCGKTLIDHVLDRLVAAGVATAVVNTRYKAELLEEHLLGRGDIEILISRETENLDTGGGIAHALPKLGTRPFFSLNADALWLEKRGEKPLLRRLAEAYDASLDGVLALCPQEEASGYRGRGDFHVKEGALRLRTGEETADYVFMGVQILHPRLFAGIGETSYSLRRFYEHPEGWIPRMKAVVHRGRWLHVGDPEGIAEAESALEGGAI